MAESPFFLSIDNYNSYYAFFASSGILCPKVR